MCVENRYRILALTILLAGCGSTKFHVHDSDLYSEINARGAQEKARVLLTDGSAFEVVGLHTSVDSTSFVAVEEYAVADNKWIRVRILQRPTAMSMSSRTVSRITFRKKNRRGGALHGAPVGALAGAVLALPYKECRTLGDLLETGAYCLTDNTSKGQMIGTYAVSGALWGVFIGAIVGRSETEEYQMPGDRYAPVQRDSLRTLSSRG